MANEEKYSQFVTKEELSNYQEKLREGEGFSISNNNVASVLPATQNKLGGIKAKPKTNKDTQEIHIDTSTGELFTKTGSGGITFVETLPAKTQEEYDKHLLYLKNGENSLKYLGISKGLGGQEKLVNVEGGVTYIQVMGFNKVNGNSEIVCGNYLWHEIGNQQECRKYTINESRWYSGGPDMRGPKGHIIKWCQMIGDGSYIYIIGGIEQDENYNTIPTNAIYYNEYYGRGRTIKATSQDIPRVAEHKVVVIGNTFYIINNDKLVTYVKGSSTANTHTLSIPTNARYMTTYEGNLYTISDDNKFYMINPNTYETKELQVNSNVTIGLDYAVCHTIGDDWWFLGGSTTNGTSTKVRKFNFKTNTFSMQNDLTFALDQELFCTSDTNDLYALATIDGVYQIIKIIFGDTIQYFKINSEQV